jgi:hypothetical protein
MQRTPKKREHDNAKSAAIQDAELGLCTSSPGKPGLNYPDLIPALSS